MFPLAKALVIGMFILGFTACSAGSGGTAGSGEQVCPDGNLNVGFYAFFAPVSSSADKNPASEGFDTHVGFEADLLTAVEAMKGGRLTFSRKGIGEWDNIWLLSSKPEYDLIGGGITILDSRTEDPSGTKVVNFTSGHISFRQSLLVQAEDKARFPTHADLTSEARVGALAGTTGEARMLQLTGLANEDGVLASGVKVDTPQGTVVADGSPSYFITAAGASDGLAGRLRLHPPSEDMPQVIYLGDHQLGEAELIAALSDGTIDALARGEVGNRDASSVSNQKFVLTAIDEAAELGGFTLSVKDDELRSCLNKRLDWLTDNRKISYGEWLENPAIFMERANMWKEGA